MMLLVVFVINWQVFPFRYTFFSDSPIDWARGIFLPSIALSLGLAAAVARQLRAAMAEAMESKYVRAMWAKGATRRTVARHALKNAAIPAVTVFGLFLGGLLGGALIVERIYSIPGLGSYIVNGVIAHDLPVIQGVAIMFVLIYVTISLLLDITYGFLNPRGARVVTTIDSNPQTDPIVAELVTADAAGARVDDAVRGAQSSGSCATRSRWWRSGGSSS